jgi:hypothetical protein
MKPRIWFKHLWWIDKKGLHIRRPQPVGSIFDILAREAEERRVREAEEAKERR